nr:sugar ABC transporter substrate-binding protein [Symbiobacterium terraclitae]
MLVGVTACSKPASNAPAEPATPSTQSGGSSQTDASLEGVPEALTAKQIRVAVVRNLSSDDHTKQFLDGARKEGESFGFSVDTFLSDGDDSRFQELVAQAIQKGYDGLIVSHGKVDYSYDMLKPAVDKGMKVVAFDTIIDKNGESLPEVTTTFQDDFKLAELSLEEVAALAQNGQPVRVLKLWMAGFPPLDRRETIYKQFEEAGKIVTLETVGVSNFQDVQGDIAAKVGALLAKYPPGTVDAIWACWDEMAKGAYQALVENNRTDIPMISIDISNQDINLMREPGSKWIATAAVDPQLIGIVDMRLLAKKFAGEPTPLYYDLEAKLIKQEHLKPETNMTNLNDVVPGWGESDAFNEPWMDTLRAKYGK